MQSACPFVQPIPMQGSVGQIQIMRLPCTNICPLAEYDNGGQWKTRCSNNLQIFKLEEEEKDVLDSKIIKLN
jgi:hypothetical protein